MMGRVAKRAEVAEREPETEMQITAPVGPNGENPSTGRLTEKQKAIQQQILRRRAGA